MRLHSRHTSPVMGNVNDYVANIYRKYVDLGRNKRRSCPMQLIKVYRL